MFPKSQYIAGIDEVGKGSLFGPVFAAAVVLTNLASIKLVDEGLKDSKLLKPSTRNYLVPLIHKEATAWGLGQSSAKEIDNIGIRAATEMAMIRALHRLPKTPDLVIIDGSLPLRPWMGNQETLIKGDVHCPAIAAASVIAKVARDSLIRRLSVNFPEYGLEKSVGYGTSFHRDSIKKLGPTPLHRLSFLSKIII